jgi:hypothetical protein
MSERSDAGQPAMFELAKLSEQTAARWMFPCGLCNGYEVAESGGLCESCSPVPVRKPGRRRTSARTTKTATTRKRSASAKAPGRRGGEGRG